MSQESYVINPALLRQKGIKAGDEISVHISVCSDAVEQYKQIWLIEYRVQVVN